MVEIDKKGIVKGDVLEKNEYIQLNPGCYITTDVNILETNVDIKVITICRWKEGESGRDLMGFSGAAIGYWGVNGENWEIYRGSAPSTTIYEKSTVIFHYHDNSDEHGTYQIGALDNDSTRTKYIYYVEIWVDGVLRGKFLPEKGGMRNTVTNTFCPTNNSNWELSTDNEVMFFKNDRNVNPNLFNGTNIEHSNNEYLTARYEFDGDRNVGLIPDKTYTITVCYTPGNGMTDWIPHVNLGGVYLCTILNKQASGKQICSTTFVMPQYSDTSYIGHTDMCMFRRPNDGTVTDNTTIHWIKVEEGDKFTGYTLSELEGFTPIVCENPVECNEIKEI